MMLSKNWVKGLILIYIFAPSIHLTAMFRHIKQTTPHFTTPISASTKQKIKEIEAQRARGQAEAKRIQEEKEAEAKKIREDVEAQRLQKETKEEIETLQIKSQRLKQCYDLMLLLDDTEKIESKDQSVSRDFVVALVERNFPIIVSRSVVYNVCIQYQSYNPLNHLVLSTKAKGLFKPLLYSINLTDNDWYCYDHPIADIMLFVP